MENTSSADLIVPPPERAGDIGPDRRGAFQTWTGKSIEGQIHSRSLDAAYRRWLFHRATRQPRLRDMYVDTTMFEQTMLTQMIGDDHLVVAQSESYIASLGRNIRGVLSSELKYAASNSLREILTGSLVRNQPYYVRYISSLSTRNVYWESLILPLAAHEKAKPIFALSCLNILSEKTDLLQILYDRSPVGIVAAVPIMDGQSKTDDARILTMNFKAREILRQPEEKGQLYTVGELVRDISAKLRWTASGTSIHDHATTIEYNAPDGERFSMTIELINHFVLLTIAPATIEQTPTRNRFARLLGLA